MSHYTCLVIGEGVEAQLDPFSENDSVEPYKAYWDSADVERWERILQETHRERKTDDGKDETIELPPEQVLAKEYTLEDMVRVYTARYEPEDPPEIDDGGIFEMSTYNPQSKWDWWEIGGRWTGFFKLREDRPTNGKLGRPGTFDNKPKHDADQARKGDVAIEWMRNNAAEKAGELWDRIDAVIRDLPVALGWEQHYVGRVKMADEGLDEYTIEQARKDYHDQPRVIALKEWNDALPDEEKVLGFFGPGVEEFQVTREEFVETARQEVLCPFAYLKDGEWHAPGKMGWFGNSSDDMHTRKWFREEFNAILDELPEDTLLTLCDLHI